MDRAKRAVGFVASGRAFGHRSRIRLAAGRGAVVGAIDAGSPAAVGVLGRICCGARGASRSEVPECPPLA
ncbi:hypothetical protein RW092_14285 [Paenibacillus sp. 3LSP]|uniref:hypothetical protein n=1 Tax=Paenibacillus sp. 3LSP TaxID=2800795 RepID=UPI0028FD1362|nr:hypothetical protein [Paenibacillus sp. 3LSP]MDU0331359.1 hypothetical protein [Paenibacillus sp. 3LSP]